MSDRARQSQQAAQETMYTLSQILLQDRSLTAKLNATRVWSVLLGGTPNDDFANSTCSRPFLEIIRSVIDQRRPGDVLRDRLVDVVGAGTWTQCRNNPQHQLAQLWLQVKPYNASNEVSQILAFLILI